LSIRILTVYSLTFLSLIFVLFSEAEVISLSIDIVIPMVIINLLVLLILTYLEYSGKLGLFFFLLCTLCFFIFGRHISFLLTDNNIFYWDFYGGITFSQSDFVENTFIALLAINSIFLGFTLPNRFVSNDLSKIYISNSYIKFILVLTLILYIPFFSKLLISVANEGYVGMYITMQDAINNGDITFRIYSLSYTLLLVGCSMALVAQQKSLIYLSLGLLFIRAISLMLMGQRAYFFCVILFLLFLFFRNNKVSFRHVILLFVLFLILIMLSGLILTFRSGGNFDFFIEHLVFSELIGDFFYSQGVTFFVFSLATEINNFPLLPTIQNFIPGSSFLYSLLFGSVEPTGQSYAHFLSETTNAGLYSKGFGLGWSFLGDLMLLSPFFYIVNLFIFGVLFGSFFRHIELKSESNQFYLFILLSVAVPFLYLPRSGLNTIFPLMIYAVMIYVVIMCLFTRRKYE
jgi:hypothetical protein